MAYEGPAQRAIDEDFCLPGLELQHDLQLSLPAWESAGEIVQRLSNTGAELHALSLRSRADGFVLNCRVKAISAAQARAFVAELSHITTGAASVEHLLLATARDNAGA